MRRITLEALAVNGSNEATPLEFFKLSHFEALRAIKNRQPDQQLNLSTDSKAQLNLYMHLRAKHQNSPGSKTQGGIVRSTWAVL